MGHTDYERTSGEWSRSVAAGSEGGVRKAGHPPPKPPGGLALPLVLPDAPGLRLGRAAPAPRRVPLPHTCTRPRCGSCGSAQGRKGSSRGFLTARPALWP